MNCEDIKLRMLDIIYDATDPEVESHIANCPNCKETLERYRHVLKELGPAGQIQSPPPELFNRIQKGAAPRSRFKTVSAGILAAAACAAIVTGIFVAVAREKPTSKNIPELGLAPKAEQAMWERYEPLVLKAKRRRMRKPIFDAEFEKALDREVPVGSKKRILTKIWEKWPSKV